MKVEDIIVPIILCTDYGNILNDKKCVGRTIIDPDDQSSQFFSRGRCDIDMETIKN